VGLAALTEVGRQLYGDADPAPVPQDLPDLLDVRPSSDGFELTMTLPLARREDLELTRTGDELAITVAGHRRVLALPSALRRCTVADATLRSGRLVVRFEPDPDLWMRS
jgi:arsenite-transporting ATPase